MELTKKAIMEYLNITPEDLSTVSKYPDILEKLFSSAVLRQGTVITHMILTEYNLLKETLFCVEKKDE